MPYQSVAKLRFRAGHQSSVREIRQTIFDKAKISKTNKVSKTNIVLRTFKGFGKDRSGVEKEWLQLDRLRDGEGKLLTEGRYSRQIKHLQESKETKTDPLWLFTTNATNKEKLQKALKSICEELNCDIEERYI